MGSGKWSPNIFRTRAARRRKKNQDAFSYSMGASGVHPTLNPHGLEVRESRDSDEHPDSNSIIIGLDVSGSMGAVVRGIHRDLPQLLGLLLDRQYIPHPQIMFAAFSNGSSDPVPMQVGQFESDNRMDENLENMILGGRLAGGTDAVHESAELMLYMAARHTSIDCWEKRQRKGFLFLITDEMAYEEVKATEVERIFGSRLPKNISLGQILEETQERYHVFVIIPTQTDSGKKPAVHQFLKSYFDPQHVILLENAEDVAETIALTIGLTERTISLKEGLSHLEKAGAGKSTLDSLSRALSLLDGDAVGSAGSLDDLDQGDGKRGARRL
jgi:hypothetical protein